MLLFGLLLSAALASVQPSTSPSQMPSRSPATGPSTSPSTSPSIAPTMPSTSPSIAPTMPSLSPSTSPLLYTCAELVAKYPECDEEYQGATPCDPSQEDLDYIEANCDDDSSDEEEDDVPECPSGGSATCCDVDGSCFDGDDDWCCDEIFYCSNDGEEYANAMGGILCPTSTATAPTTSAPTEQPSLGPTLTAVTGATYTVESRLAMSGVTSSNFESMKSALKTVIADFFVVAESKVSLAFDANGRRMLLTTGEIVVTIATTDSTEAYTVRDTMETPTFTTSLTTEITTQSSTFTELSGVSVSSATAPSVSAATITTATATTIATTTTSMEGSATALMSFVAIIASALLF